MPSSTSAVPREVLKQVRLIELRRKTADESEGLAA